MSVIGLDPYGPIISKGAYSSSSQETIDAKRLSQLKYKVGDKVKIMRCGFRFFTNGKIYTINGFRWNNYTGWLNLTRDDGQTWYTLWYHIYDTKECINQCDVYCPEKEEDCPFYVKREEGK